MEDNLGPRKPTPSTTSLKNADGAYNLADFASLGTQATTYQYSGSWKNPEAGQKTLLDEGGLAQRARYYDRSGRWRVGTCLGFGTYTSTDEIGCGPAAFSAMLFYHFKYKGAKVSGFKYGNPAFKLKHLLTTPVGSQGVPRIVKYMGSCFFNGGVATSAGAFSNAGKAFLKDYASDLHLSYNWSNGFANQGSVGKKVDRLLYARDADRPAVVLYPFKTLNFHFSFIKSWKAKGRKNGLFYHT